MVVVIVSAVLVIVVVTAGELNSSQEFIIKGTCLEVLLREAYICRRIFK